MPAHTPPPETDPAGLGRFIVDRCRGLGFALAGVCDAAPPERVEFIREWLGAGKHGEMSYLADQLAERLDHDLLLEGARSFIMVADRYSPRERRKEGPSAGAPPLIGRVARYARGRDYHRAIKKRLHNLADSLRPRFPGHAFRSFVDTAPVLERQLAARAGIGWVGKHTLIIHPGAGSWFLLGGIATTLHLEPPPEQEAVADHCGACTRCIDACPTGAITPYSVDASRCISYLTIEHRSPIDPALAPRTGDWLFGCDVCQEVCPHNAPKGRTAPRSRMRGGDDKVHAAYAPRHDGFDLLEVLGWTPPQRRDELATGPMKRATMGMFKRNAVMALANILAAAPDHPQRAEAIAHLRLLADDPGEPALAAEAARAALSRLARR